MTLRFTTENGSKYEVSDSGFPSKNGVPLGFRVWTLYTFDWDDYWNGDLGFSGVSIPAEHPEVGRGVYLVGKDGWQTTSNVVEWSDDAS